MHTSPAISDTVPSVLSLWAGNTLQSNETGTASPDTGSSLNSAHSAGAEVTFVPDKWGNLDVRYNHRTIAIAWAPRDSSRVWSILDVFGTLYTNGEVTFDGKLRARGALSRIGHAYKRLQA